MTTSTAVLFWTCLAGVVYAYAGYPLTLVFFSRLFGSRRVKPTLADEQLPTVTLLVAA